MAARQHRVETITGAPLIAALAAAEAWLAANAAQIDRLNVFPVPDGDTGTNLRLTLRGVLDAVRDSGSLAVVPEAALRAARGNSGVLLAAWLGGLVLAKDGSLDAGAVERWLAGGAAAARASVVRPVEGTILTAMTAAAPASAGAEPLERLEAAASAALTAALASRSQMALLADAGVVDAGALGFALLLDAIAAHLAGRPPSPLPEGLGQIDPAWRDSRKGSALGHCLRFSLVATGADAASVRQRLAGLGDSVVVAGVGDRLGVHLHTGDVAAVLEAAADLGRIDDITDEDMDAAAADLLAQTPRTVVVAVVKGEEWRQLFASFGAVVVDDPAAVGGAISAAMVEGAVVLTSGAALVSAAGDSVLPTASPPTGLAALLAFDPEADVETNLDAMARAAAAVTVVPVTRDASLDLEPPAGATLLTLYHGAQITADEAETLAETLRLLYPALEVEVVFGGQGKPEYYAAFQA